MGMGKRVSAVGVAALLSVGSVLADYIEIEMSSFTGTPTTAKVSIENVGNSIVFKIYDVDPTSDIRGLFLDVDGFGTKGLVAGDISGADITKKLVLENGVINLGGGNNLNPADAFDVGLEIGTPGATPDFIATTTFTIDNSDNLLSLDDFTRMGLRLTSVGADGEGSSKLLWATTTHNVPEPSVISMLLLGLGCLSVGLFRRKRAK